MNPLPHVPLREEEELFASPSTPTIQLSSAYYPSNFSNITPLQRQNNFGIIGPQVLPQGQAMCGAYPALPTVDPFLIAASLPNELRHFDDNGAQFDQHLADGHLSHDMNTIYTGQGSTNYKVHYGQITPPSDHTLIFNSAPSRSPHDLDTSQVKHRLSSSDGYYDKPATHRRRGGGRRRSSEQTHRESTSAEPSSSSEDKQEKTRARNRLAASKCREKKRKGELDLAKTFNCQQSANLKLKNEVSILRNQIAEYKGRLLEHHHCPCPDPAIRVAINRLMMEAAGPSTANSLPENKQDPPGPSGGFHFDPFTPWKKTA